MRQRAQGFLQRQRSAPPLPAAAVTTIWMLLTLSLLAVWFTAYAVFFSGVQERRNNAVLYSQLRQNLAEATAPIGGAITAGTPIALLESRVSGLKHTVIVEGTAARQLTQGPGHRRDSPLPGQVGVAILFGRSLTYGGPFSALGQFRRGDAIKITTAQGQFFYRVQGLRHKGDPLPAPLPSGGSALLLETSSGTRLAPTNTEYLDAVMTSKSVGSPGGTLTAIPPAERAWHADSSGLQSLVLWLQLLGVSLVATIWARFRWGGRQSWLLGIPLILAALWGATGNVLLLLPNLV